MIEALAPAKTPPPPLPVAASAVMAKPSRISFFQRVSSWADWLFGFFALLIGLAILSVIPILNLLSLGYLLEASGRVARTGTMRAAFVGIRKASTIGSIAIGTALTFLPALFISSMWKDAELISPGARATDVWQLATIVATTAACLLSIWAIARGGRFRHFLWPAPVRLCRALVSKATYRELRDGCLDYLAALRLPYYFWLGFRGFVGAVVWLIIPVGILIGGANISGDGLSLLVSLVGAVVLAIVAMYLPFLQANFARTGHFEDLFSLREVRSAFRCAPVAFWLALFITLLFSLPLYLAKIELAPRELAWLPSLLFVVFIFPSRLLTGWALSRGLRRELPRHGFFAWTSRLAGIPVLLAYAFFIYLMQYLSWHGSWGMLEQHAFLVPAPMLTM